MTSAGISRATFFRWVREGRIADVRFRDRNGRRLFTDDELRTLSAEANKLLEASPQISMRFDSKVVKEADANP